MRTTKTITYLSRTLECSANGVWITPKDGKAFFLPATLISEVMHEIVVLQATWKPSPIPTPNSENVS